MTGQRIISALTAWLKAAVTGHIFFMFMILLVYDTMHSVNLAYEVILFSLLNFLIYFLASMFYIFFILIPVGFFDRKAFDTMPENELISRYLPFTLLMFAVIATLAFSLFRHEENMFSEVFIVCTTFFNAFFGGLIFFVYTARKRDMGK